MKTTLEIPDDLFAGLNHVAQKRRTPEQTDEEAAALPVALIMERLSPFLEECADLMGREKKQVFLDKNSAFLDKLANVDEKKRDAVIAAADAAADAEIAKP